MANIHSEEFIYKYGRLVQFGTNYMIGYSQFADDFHNARNGFMQELNDYGYSMEWVNWQKNNSDAIINLYDSLEEDGLIPSTPE